ncbi:MAG: hypothetical protein ACXACR_02455 [Candidatus Hodarchaeales archaeon]|jgi:hypothetical protein
MAKIVYEPGAFILFEDIKKIQNLTNAPPKTQTLVRHKQPETISTLVRQEKILWKIYLDKFFAEANIEQVLKDAKRIEEQLTENRKKVKRIIKDIRKMERNFKTIYKGLENIPL